MQPEFWHKKWESNQIGFHLPEVNPYLQRHWAVPATARVLVPLCGKSLDLAWLAGRGHQRLGCGNVDGNHRRADLKLHVKIPEARNSVVLAQGGPLCRG